MKKLLLCILIMSGFCIGQIFRLGTHGSVYAGDLIIGMSFGLFELNMNAIIQLMFEFMSFLIFVLFYGTEIYSRLCSAGIYYFYRTTKRKIWILKSAFGLLVLCLVYEVFYYTFSLAFSSLVNDVSWNTNAVLPAVYMMIINAVWLFIITFATNIISVFLGSHLAFSLVVAVNYAFFLLLTLSMRGGRFDVYEEMTRETGLKVLKINPVSNLIGAWHFNDFLIADNAAESIELRSFFSSILLEIIIALIVTFTAAVLSDRLEIYDNYDE